jgi:MFS family permease
VLTPGIVGIIRTMVAELVPEKELQPRAFSIMPLVWSIGAVFGPAFGGFFANPADRFPAVFGKSTFFKEYPYALPNIVAAVFFLISMTTATLFLKETLEGRREHMDWGLLMGKRLTRPFRRGRHQPRPVRRRSFVDGEATAPLLPTRRSGHAQSSSPPGPPSLSKVFSSQTTINLIAYTFLALHSVSYDQVLPVFLNHPVQPHTPDNTQLPFRFSGGFGLSADKIGTIFTIYGVACGLIQFIVFPPLCTWLGVLNCYKACCEFLPSNLRKRRANASQPLHSP